MNQTFFQNQADNSNSEKGNVGAFNSHSLRWPSGGDSCGTKASAHLEVVGLVVVHVERPEELGVAAHHQLLRGGHALVDGLPGELLHLDVVELPEVAEPLDQLGGDAAIELSSETSGTLSFIRDAVVF